MTFASIQELQECVLYCRQFACPFRNKAHGYYPKPPRGPVPTDVMLIFENPGSPSGRNLAVENNPEMAYDISDAKLPEVLRLCIIGQKNWLFEHQGADEDLWEEFGFRIGETIYTTDSHKCPNPKEKEKSTPALTAR